MTRPNLPTHLGEDPFLISPCTSIPYVDFCTQLPFLGQKRGSRGVEVRFFLIRVCPTDSASFCLDLMKKYRCRHLWVFADDAFIEIISIRDLVAKMIDEKEELIEDLEHDITS